jgi:hypothetical protein
MSRSASRILAGIILGFLTVAVYMAWLGWDRHYDVDKYGEVSGPYQTWQVVGLVICLGALGIFAGLFGQRNIAIVLIPAVFTVAWFIGALTTIGASQDGLEIVGAYLVAVGSFLGIALVAAIGDRIRRSLHKGRTAVK